MATKSATKSKAVGSDPYKIYDTEMTGATQSGDKTKTQDETIAGGASTSGTIGAVRNGFVARATGSDPYKTYDTELSGATQAGDKSQTKDEQIAGATTGTTGAVVNKASWMGADLNGQTVKKAGSESGSSATTATPTATGTGTGSTSSAKTTTADQAYDETLRASSASSAIANGATASQTGAGTPAVPGSATKSEADRQAAIDDQKQNLWDSLEYSYGKKIEKSNKQYADAKNTADLQSQKRGMGRSSYNQQILANYDRDAAEAANDIYSEMIADYQNRVGEIEKNALENEHWEAEFGEKVRSNMAQEALSGRQLTESERSNRAQEALSGRQLTEAERSNKAQEALTGRQLTEAERSNLAQEALTGRQLTETERSNLAQEAYNLSALEETIRSNKADEAYNTAYLEETSRHNQAEEDYNLQALEETKRSNEESEKINWASIDAQYGDHSSSNSSSSSGSSGSPGGDDDDDDKDKIKKKSQLKTHGLATGTGSGARSTDSLISSWGN